MMLAIKGYYQNGKIELFESLPSEINSAELAVVVFPDCSRKENLIPESQWKKRYQDAENDFELLGLKSFFDEANDANIDWEDYFGIK